MPFFLLFDPTTWPPLAGLIDRTLFDFDIVNVVMWGPRLSWAEIGKALAAIFACKFLSDQLDRLLLARPKAYLKAAARRHIVRAWPHLARRLGLAEAA